MEKEKGSSSSKFQTKFEEKIIIPELKKYFAIQETTNNKVRSKIHYYTIPNESEGDFKVQIDFCDEVNNRFGEIFVCGDKFLPGQQRKLATDILKLLTVEKLLKKPIEKFIVLTSFDENFAGQIVKDNDQNWQISKRLLGEKSWKIKSLIAFEIDVLIYYLTSCQKEELDEVRKSQGLKFKVKDF